MLVVARTFKPSANNSCFQSCATDFEKTIKKTTEEFLGRDQFGHLKKRGIKDVLGFLRYLAERSIELNHHLYLIREL